MAHIRQLSVRRIQLAPTPLPTLRSLEEREQRRGLHIQSSRLCSLSVTQVYFHNQDPDLLSFSPAPSLLSDVRWWCQPDQNFCTALARRLVAHGVGSQLRFLSQVVSGGEPSAFLESITRLCAVLRALFRPSGTRTLNVLGGHRRLIHSTPSSSDSCWDASHSPSALVTPPPPGLLRRPRRFLSPHQQSALGNRLSVQPRLQDDWLDRMFGVLAARASHFANLEHVVFELCTAYTYMSPTAEADGGAHTLARETAERIAMGWA
ncbi:hypothetical protein LXA43DRAFT_1012186, partial [Ganoderma leucocontextum]